MAKVDIGQVVPTLQNNLTTTASGYALDARQGRNLNDRIQECVNVEKFTSATVEVASNGVKTVNIPYTVPSGYTLKTAKVLSIAGSTNVVAQSITIGGSNITVTLVNVRTSAVNVSCTVEVISNIN